MKKTVNDTNWVKNRRDLIEYVKLLLDDFKVDGQNWENSNLENYLDAIKRYSQDIGGYYKNTNQGDPEEPTWKLFADILKGASIYE